MTLASSGTMSIGGTTQDRSINLELKRSATATSSMGETSLRDLADVSSGTISMSNFYGKSYYKWFNTVTIGNVQAFGQTFEGYGSVGNPSNPTTFGSTTDTTCDLYSTAPSWALYHVNNNATQFFVFDTAGTPTGNAGWSQVHFYIGQQNTNGTTYVTRLRTGSSYYTTSGLRSWSFGQKIFSVSSVWVTVGFVE